MRKIKNRSFFRITLDNHKGLKTLRLEADLRLLLISIILLSRGRYLFHWKLTPLLLQERKSSEKV